MEIDDGEVESWFFTIAIICLLLLIILLIFFLMQEKFYKYFCFIYYIILNTPALYMYTEKKFYSSPQQHSQVLGNTPKSHFP